MKDEVVGICGSFLLLSVQSIFVCSSIVVTGLIDYWKQPFNNNDEKEGSSHIPKVGKERSQRTRYCQIELVIHIGTEARDRRTDRWTVGQTDRPKQKKIGRTSGHMDGMWKSETNGLGLTWDFVLESICSLKVSASQSLSWSHGQLLQIFDFMPCACTRA